MSLNLSFKEWPFFPFNKHQPSHSFKSSAVKKGDNDPHIHTSNLPIAYISSFEYNNMKTFLTKVNSHPSDENITEFNKIPINYHLSSWGRCGLFASTNEGSLSIFSNDNRGSLTPILMFSPFEKYKSGSISKRPAKSSFITAIAWADGHLQPCIPKPVIAISSEKGLVIIYDIKSRNIIDKFNFNEPIVSILWSSFKINRFYAGSSTGHFYVCDVCKKSIQIVKMFDFSAFSSKTIESIHKSIDFITQDDVDGYTIAIASKDGSIGFITNLNKPSQSQLQVFQNFNFIGGENQASVCINFFKFYPNSQDFITIATNTSTFLVSLAKAILIPFINTQNCKFISLISGENDKAVIGDDKNITVWQLAGHSWVRSYVTKIDDILTFSKNENKILLTTASNWLTQIEYKRGKLFVTKRIRLINGKPIDYDIGNGSIAILINNNTVSLTKYTPEAVVKSKFAEKRRNSSEESSQLSHGSDDSNAEYSEAPLFMNNENETSSISQSQSLDFEIKTISMKSSDVELHHRKSESDIFNQDSLFKYPIESMRGNSNTFALSFKIGSDDVKIKHIEWIAPHKIVAWCKKALYLIDLQKRKVTEPLKKTFDKKTIKITKVFFSMSYKIMCLVLNYKHVYFLNAKSNFNIINSIDFSKMTTNDNILGSISPCDDLAVFVSGNTLFFMNINGEMAYKTVNSSLEFNASYVSWNKKGIFIGTEKGSAFMIRNRKIANIIKISEMTKYDVKVIYDSFYLFRDRMASIKLVKQCANKSYLIVDSNGHGLIVSNDVQQFAENILSIRQCSPSTFLVRLQNYNKLIVISSFGDFVPSLPPSYFSTQTNNVSFNSSKNDLLESFKDIKSNNNIINSITHQLFLTDETNHSISLRNSVHLLNQIISFHDPFNSLSSKTFLKLGNLEKARTMLLSTDRND